MCSMDTDYRLIREDDAAAIIEFMTVIGGDTDNLPFSASDFASVDPEDEKYVIREIRKGRNIYAIAVSDGKIIGSCEIRAQGDRTRIRHRADIAIAVRKDFWGMGIAKHLLDYSLAEAKDRGFTKICLEVRSDNDRARRFYETNGFFHEGGDSRLFLIDGRYVSGEHYGIEL